MTPVNQTPTLFGSPAPVESASRRVTLTPGIRTLRVASGETVAFRAGNRTVGWTFLEAIGGTSALTGASSLPAVSRVSIRYGHFPVVNTSSRSREFRTRLAAGGFSMTNR
ncbi:CzcE family metal-binding protein [Cupriavidus sp. Agwp_2]|uniref:CzcE family metal-binding protein n=1 Tax=Cupriavidus sp. Agwp_2 TaxID=2897324 RepID=UPI00345F8DFB